MFTKYYLATKAEDKTRFYSRETVSQETSSTLKRKLSPDYVNLDLDLGLSIKTSRENEKKMKTMLNDDHEVDSSLSLSLFSPSKEIIDRTKNQDQMTAISTLDLSL